MSNIINEISKDKPTGVDYKYEDSYLAIEAEIDKTMSASSAGEVDWKLICEEAEDILEKKSKDLKIASYWLYAKWKLSSWEGLEFALPFYTTLISTYEMKLFPKSTKVKLRILEWLHDSLTVAIFRSIDDLDKEKILRLLEAFENLEETLIQSFKQENLKVFAPLIRKLKKHNEEKKRQDSLDKEIVQEKKEEKKEIALSSKDEPVAIEIETYNLEEHRQKLKQDLMTIQESSLLFEINLTIGFSKFEEAFLTKERMDRESFPSNEVLEYLEILEGKKEYLSMLKGVLLIYPCWLEGYVFLIGEMSRKRELKHNKIDINTLKYKLIYFIKNNNEKIHNCQPLEYSVVGKVLQKWINLEENLFIDNDIYSQYEHVYQEALRLRKEKGKDEAVSMLNNIKKESKTTEESFLWTLKQVYLAFEIDNKNMAIALLYALDQEIERFNLEEWRPDLAVEVYNLFLKPNINKILNSEKKELIYRKLCRLSTKDAMKIGFL